MRALNDIIKNGFIRQVEGISSFYFEYKDLFKRVNIASYSDILADEISASEKYATRLMKEKYLTNRLLIKVFLSSGRAVKPDKIHIKTDCNGRPFAEGFPDFNISHTEDDLYIIFSSKYRLGCDIERIERFNQRLIDGAYYFCSEEELRALDRLDNTHHKRAFLCRVWTLKEAVLKLIGKGFLYDPKTFSVIDDDSMFLRNIELGKLNIELTTGYFKESLMFALSRCLPMNQE